MLLSSLLLLLLPTVALGYKDVVPDPDFLINMDDMAQINKEQTLPGYVKRLIKEVLARPGVELSVVDRSILSRADQTDPQTLVDILLKVLDDQKKCSNSEEFVWWIPDIKMSLPGPIILSVTITALFLLCYFYKAARRFTLTLLLFASYCYSVYSRLQLNYLEMVSGKMSALEKDLPGHCRSEFTLTSWLSAVWSTVQVGDQCKKYHTQIISDPLMGIKPFESLFYPLMSLPLIPLTVLGEVLGPFLENILAPFSFPVQLTVLAFLSVLIFSIAYAAVSLRPNATPPPPQVSPEKLEELQRAVLSQLEELRCEFRRSVETDIMVINEVPSVYGGGRVSQPRLCSHGDSGCNEE